MCIAPKRAKLPPVPEVKDEPVAPMQSPEDISKDSTGAIRKAKSRKGLKIDLNASGTGLNIPV